MRPRVFPAEDDRHVLRVGDGQPASMRPRVFPAEDRFMRRIHASTTACFNEAAGIPRGRLLQCHVATPRVHASMRPRVFPAEDDQRGGRLLSGGKSLQ